MFEHFSARLAIAFPLIFLLLFIGCGSKETFVYSGEVPVASTYHQDRYWLAAIRLQHRPVAGYSPVLYSAKATAPNELELIRDYTTFIDSSPDVLPRGAAGLAFAPGATEPTVWAVPNKGEIWTIPGLLARRALTSHLAFLPTDLEVVSISSSRTLILVSSAAEMAFALLEDKGLEVSVIRNVVGAGCEGEACWLAEYESSVLRIKMFNIATAIEEASVAAEISLSAAPRSTVCSGDGRNFIVAGDTLVAFSSHATDITKKKIPAFQPLGGEAFLRCGPNAAKGRYWLATSKDAPNDVTTIGENGDRLTVTLPASYSLRTIAANNSGWVVAQSKRLPSKTVGNYCNIRECETETEVPFSMEILPILIQ